MAKYNFSPEKKIKNAAYRSQVPADVADRLYEEILRKMVIDKKYRDHDYNAQVLARELNTNARCVSAVVNHRFGMNYSCLVNEYRVREAQFLLIDKRYADKTIEQVSSMVGFSNRQSFYAAFYRFIGATPNEYRKAHSRKETGRRKRAKRVTSKKK